MKAALYSDKIQVIINCPYSVAQMCTRKDKLAHFLGAPFIDDVMRHNTLITSIAPSRVFIGGFRSFLGASIKNSKIGVNVVKRSILLLYNHLSGRVSLKYGRALFYLTRFM